MNAIKLAIIGVYYYALNQFARFVKAASKPEFNMGQWNDGTDLVQATESLLHTNPWFPPDYSRVMGDRDYNDPDLFECIADGNY